LFQPSFGEVVNASIIALMVVVSIVINFVQTWHSQRAAEEAKAKQIEVKVE
jgi:type II secretory pathway component PulL